MLEESRRGVDDAQLVERALAGDGMAFTELYRRHVSAVAATVHSLTSTADDRADFVQEAFTTAFARLAQLRDPARFRAWVLQIARNAVTTRGRASGRVVAVDGDQLDGPGPADDPADTAALLDLVARLGAAHATLPTRDATAVTLVVTFGLSTAELAVALGVSETNAKVILHRARQRLRAALAASGWST